MSNNQAVKTAREEKVLNYKQVSEILGIGESTVYDMAKAGRLKCFRIGGKGGGYRFRLQDVLDFMRPPAAPNPPEATPPPLSEPGKKRRGRPPGMKNKPRLYLSPPRTGSGAA
jgi:excisionase family DNA binding protein